jgi:hypothetical protein
MCGIHIFNRIATDCGANVSADHRFDGARVAKNSPLAVAIHGIESTRRPGRAIRLGAIHPSSLGDAPFSLEGNLLRRKMQPTGQSLFPSQQPKVDRISHCLIPGIVRMQVIAFVVGWEHAR